MKKLLPDGLPALETPGFAPNERRPAKRRKKAQPKLKRQYKKGITRAIIENANSTNPLSPVELAAAFGITPAAIYSRISVLRRQGRLPPSERQLKGTILDPDRLAQSEPPEPGTDPSPDFLRKAPQDWDSTDLAAIDRLPVLNADQRKKLLSAIGMRPSAGVGQASALKALDDMDKGAGSQIGPPPPLTEDDQIVRLSRLMRAVGQVITQKSMEAAFESSSSQENGDAAERGAVSGGESNVA